MTPRSAPDGYEKAIELTQRAIECSDETHYKEGEKLLRQAMDLAPDEPAFTENYVQFCLQVASNCTLAEDHPEAIIYYRKVLEIVTDDAEAWMDLGACYARNNNPLEALQAWQSALALLNPRKGKDKENIEAILENVRTVQKAIGAQGIG